MSDAPAGWYPDPTPLSAVPTLRYWDGATWTEHVAPAHQYAGAAPVGPTTPDGVPLASYGARVGAHLIDTALVGTVSAFLSLPMQLRMSARTEELTRSLEGADPDFGTFWAGYADLMREMMVWQLPITVAGLAYFVAMLRWRGATVGKLALGLKVRLREQDGRLPWSAIALRVAAFNGVSLLPILLVAAGWWPVALAVGGIAAVYAIADLLWPLGDGRRQALHDKIARTNVVRAR